MYRERLCAVMRLTFGFLTNIRQEFFSRIWQLVRHKVTINIKPRKEYAIHVF